MDESDEAEVIGRLEALRRAGHVERIDEDHWWVPKDIIPRRQDYDRSQGGDGIRVRTLSTLSLDRQIGVNGVTWLDRELVAEKETPPAKPGFGPEVKNALLRRAERLGEMGLATDEGTRFMVPSSIVSLLERRKVERVGRQMAAERGLPYRHSAPGEYVMGRLAGVANLMSERFAIIEDSLGFQLVPWQPILKKRIDQYISGVRRNEGGIEWSFSRNRQLGLGL